MLLLANEIFFPFIIPFGFFMKEIITKEYNRYGHNRENNEFHQLFIPNKVICKNQYADNTYNLQYKIEYPFIHNYSLPL